MLSCFLLCFRNSFSFTSQDHGVDGGGYNPDMGDGNSFQGAAPGVLATEEGYEGYEEGYDQGEGGYYDAHADKVRQYNNEVWGRGGKHD